jgi:hypothetical protein
MTNQSFARIRTRALPVLMALVGIQVAGVLWTPAPGAAQVGACDGCRVALDTVVVLDDRDERVNFSENVHLLTGNRRLWIVRDHGGEPGYGVVFGPEGDYLGKFGGPGQGPGEFTHLNSAFLTSEDSLWVLDARNMRVSVFDTQTRAFARSFNLPFVPRSADLMGDTMLVASAIIRDEEFIRYPVHSIDATGNHNGPWGTSSSQTVSPTAPYESDWFVSVDGSIIVAVPMTRLSIRVWQGAASRERRLTLPRPDWYAYEPPLGDENAWEKRPDSFIEGVHVDAGAGLIWLMFLSAAADWSPTEMPTRDEMRDQQGLRDQWYDAIVSGYDLDTGALVAERRLDRTYHAFYGGYMLRVESGPDGAPRLLVLEPALRR